MGWGGGSYVGDLLEDAYGERQTVCRWTRVLLICSFVPVISFSHIDDAAADFATGFSHLGEIAASFMRQSRTCFPTKSTVFISYTYCSSSLFAGPFILAVPSVSHARHCWQLCMAIQIMEQEYWTCSFSRPCRLSLGMQPKSNILCVCRCYKRISLEAIAGSKCENS